MRFPFYFLMIFALFAPLTAAAASLWQLEPQGDPRVPAGKITVVTGKLAAGGTRFVLKGISVNRPVQITVAAVKPGDAITIEVHKHTWNSAVVEQTTSGATPATVRFRSGTHAAIKLQGPEGAAFELFAWVGPAIQAGPPRALIAMDEHVRRGGTASRTGTPQIAGAGSSGSTGTPKSAAAKPKAGTKNARPPQTAKAAAPPGAPSALAAGFSRAGDEIARNPVLFGLLTFIAATLLILIILIRARRRALAPGRKRKIEPKIYSILVVAGLLALGAAGLVPPPAAAQDAGKKPGDEKPTAFDIAEAKTRIGAELQVLASKLEALGIAGTMTFEPRSRIGNRILEFYGGFGLIDLREAAIQPQFAAKDLPPLPSRCQQAQNQSTFASEEDRKKCRRCMSSAEASLDTWRMRLESEWVKYRITEFTAGRVLELAEPAAGLTPAMKIRWEKKTGEAPAAHRKANKAYYATYDRLNKEFTARAATALKDMAACEARFFGDREWYARFAEPYLKHLKDRYSRR